MMIPVMDFILIKSMNGIMVVREVNSVTVEAPPLGSSGVLLLF